MSYLPNLNEIPTSREMISTFYGYDHNQKVRRGSFYDECDLTTDEFPLLSPRPLRSIAKRGSALNGMLSKEALAWVDGDTLFYNDLPVDGITLSTAPEDNPKQLVSMGAYMVIFPDGVYVNTKDLSDVGSINARFDTVAGADVTYTLCRNDGTPLESTPIVSPTAPSNPANGDYWIDTSGTVHALKQYADTTQMWVSVATVFVRIGYAGIGQAFNAYDGVTISGAAYAGENEAMQEQLAKLNGDYLIYARGDDYIVVAAIIDEAYTQQAGSVTVRREAPKMDFVVESNNRLWGCFYGMHNGKMLNEIYACKLGDFKNWKCFAGLSTDSYTVSIGTDGPFTAAISYGGYPLFFKEEWLHRVFGSLPKNYQMQDTALRGVQEGCANSLQIVNETLIYKSRKEICAFDGSLPVGISDALGKEQYTNAVAGALGDKYYVTMYQGEVPYTFVYDMEKEIWHREMAIDALMYCRHDGELYYIDKANGSIGCVLGTQGEKEGQITWHAQSGIIGYEYPDHKYLSRFNIRMALDAGAEFTLAMQYDSDGVWRQTTRVVGTGRLKTFTLPIKPRRCDHLVMRLTGKGVVKLFSIAKILEIGGDGM